LGVTPSAWFTGASARTLQFSGGSLTSYSTDRIWLSQNYLQNSSGNDVYLANGYASRYRQYTGQHIFDVAASGTAGNAISFTQAMTLDASGRLGVGTTSPSARFVISDSNAAGFEFNPNASGLGQVETYNRSTGAYFELAINSKDIRFNTGTSPVERARIDSSGNFLVGVTAVIGTGKITTRTSDGWVHFISSTQATTQYFCNFDYNGTGIGSITGNNTTTTYTTSSDYRLKNTIAPMTGALAKVAQLKPVTYKWNLNGSDGQGFIAHELAEVCPDAVSGQKDAVDADGKIKPQGIDTSFLVATLTAAIQEQQVIIESLKARLDAANL
jgi:hypothetical protein